MEKQYSPEEVSQIIRKATLIQRTLQGETAGLTLKELESVASEAGISTGALVKAMDEMQAPAITAAASTSDTHIYEVRDVQPAVPEESVWEEVTDELQHTFGSFMGKVAHDARKREWIHTSAMGIETRVSLRNQGTRSRFRLSQRVGAAGSITEGLLYGSVFSGVITLIAERKMDLSTLEGFQVFSALLVVTSSLIYLADRMWRKRKAGLLSDLADRLAQLVSHAGGKSTSGTPVAAKGAEVPITRLNLDDVLFDEGAEDERPLKNVLRKRT